MAYYYFLEVIQTQAFDVLFHCAVDVVLYFLLVNRIKIELGNRSK
tara:strand:- start:4746 stop:4880 length:135 start_codon:yes stop_codon:yes gene_type:complete